MFVCIVNKSKVEILQNFVDFSEYPNFIVQYALVRLCYGAT